MKNYGICPSCLEYKYLNAKTCKTCSYEMGNCVACKRVAKIYVDGLCYCCYQDRQVLLKLKILEASFIPFNDYNKELFYLYLSYIKRYRLKYSQFETTSTLIGVLQTENIKTIKNWNDVFTLSDRYLIMQRPAKLQGCVFVKIGNMLCELGIIPPRENDRDHLIAHHLSFFSTPVVEDYAKSLLKINTAQRTVINALLILLKLESFGNQNFKINSLLKLNQFHVAQFCDQQMEILHSLQNKRKHFFNIRRFYNWAILNRYIIINPVPDMNLGRPPGKLLICSEEQFFQIKNYIKNQDTDAESALLLSLIIFFGFSTQQLAQAQVVTQDSKLYIKMKRNTLTKGKKYYCRKELLELPQNPKWFFDLQKRFSTNWSDHYQKVKKTYPNTPLILPKSNVYNRFLNTCTITRRVTDATIEATGNSIPIRVLRQTCGHIYSIKSDSSILSTLGWSEQFAFNYSWLPRTYFQEK